MKVLIINNYYRPEYQNRVFQIRDALENDNQIESEIVDFNKVLDHKTRIEVDAIILSGSSASLKSSKHEQLYKKEMEIIQEFRIPILGICFGHQLIGRAFGSEIWRLEKRVNGFIEVEILESDEIFSTWKPGEKIVISQSHRDYVSRLPDGFLCLAKSKSCEIEAMKHTTKPIYGIQGHIENCADNHNDGLQIMKNFLNNINN